MSRTRSWWLLPVLALSGCGGGTGPRDGGPEVDAWSAPDAWVADASSADDSGSDAGEPVSDGSAGDAALASRCEESADRVTCAHGTRVYRVDSIDREVHHQVPLGAPPLAGFPAVVMFQGALVSAEWTWSATAADPYGMLHQTRLVKALLDAGFAVITPEVRGDGTTYWDTNLPSYATSWGSAPDHQLMLALFEAIERGELGAIDRDALFATGISSGGYMTSRMAVSYPGRFRALAIQAGSYATCGGAFCSVPSDLPDDHPPTLFLHGGADTTVPVSTMQAYETGLRAQGTPTRVVIEPGAGHAWLAQAPAEVLAWFEARR